MAADDEGRDRELRAVGDGGSSNGGGDVVNTDIIVDEQDIRPGASAMMTQGRCQRCSQMFALNLLRTLRIQPNPVESWADKKNAGFFPTGTPQIVTTCLCCMTPDEIVQEFGAAAMVVLHALAFPIQDMWLKEFRAENHEKAAHYKEVMTHLEHVLNMLLYKRGYHDTDEKQMRERAARLQIETEVRAAFDEGVLRGRSIIHLVHLPLGEFELDKQKYALEFKDETPESVKIVIREREDKA